MALPREFDQLEVWVSPTVMDPQWDEFLRRAPCGQFQQSSVWAEYKSGAGWVSHRVILTNLSEIIGGFQILWKKTRLGRVGYVSKGPVAHPQNEQVLRSLDWLLGVTAKELTLTAVIAQSPDDTRYLNDFEETTGFVESNPMGIIESTCLVDVIPEIDLIRSKMSTSLQKNIRKAKKQGMKVREGSVTDIPMFFELMAATCLRQKTHPNPPNVEALQLLWKAFSPSQSIRLTFAEAQGAAMAAQLCIIFGDRVTLWKKGWDGTHGQWHPNEMLEDEVLEWAHNKRYRICDFCSLSRFTAERIIQGLPFSRQGLAPRDQFTLRFGGFPALLPRARVMVSNSIMHWGYCQTFVRIERLWSSFRQLTGKQ